MRLILFFAFCFMVVEHSVFAQDENIYVLEEGETLPENGRFTAVQAGILALSDVPGQIVRNIQYDDEGDTFFEFEIERVDGGVVEVDVNADRRAVVQIRVTHYVGPTTLPKPKITRKEAEVISLTYVNKRVKGVGAKVLSAELGLQNERMVYTVKIKKRTRQYEVLTDSWSGNIVDFEKLY